MSTRAITIISVVFIVLVFAAVFGIGGFNIWKLMNSPAPVGMPVDEMITYLTESKGFEKISSDGVCNPTSLCEVYFNYELATAVVFEDDSVELVTKISTSYDGNLQRETAFDFIQKFFGNEVFGWVKASVPEVINQLDPQKSLETKLNGTADQYDIALTFGIFDPTTLYIKYKFTQAK